MKDDNFDDYFDEADAPESTSSNVTAPQPAAPAADQESGKHVDFTDDIADDAAKAAAEGQPKKRKSHFWAWTLTIIIIGLGVTCYFRYFNPYITEARVTGYVTQIERRGMIFKTFEGQMITESALTDTTRIYSRDFSFSVADQTVVKQLQNLQGSGKPVTLEYERYYATVPWRGSQPVVVTGIVKQ
jgi:hypothetical protein